MKPSAATRLCIDAGNTRIKWGLHDGTAWCAKGHVPTVQAGDLATALAGLPAAECRISNVAGPEVAAWIEAALPGGPGLETRWLKSRPQGNGLRLRYDSERLGSDRYAALIAARLYAPCVVVCAGTAITVDGLDADGVFRGGLILPGRRLLTGVWSGATHALESAPGRVCDWPQTTVDALESGRIWAVVGAIEKIRGGLAANAKPRILLSGGDADWLVPHVPPPCTVVEDIVLEGLRCVD